MHNSVLKSIRLLSIKQVSATLVIAALVLLAKEDLLVSIQLREVVALSQAALLIQKNALNRILREASLFDD